MTCLVDTVPAVLSLLQLRPLSRVTFWDLVLLMTTHLARRTLMWLLPRHSHPRFSSSSWSGHVVGAAPKQHTTGCADTPLLFGLPLAEWPSEPSTMRRRLFGLAEAHCASGVQTPLPPAGLLYRVRTQDQCSPHRRKCAASTIACRHWSDDACSGGFDIVGPHPEARCCFLLAVVYGQMKSERRL